MNILVTGGSGFIGSHVVDALIEKGENIRVLDIAKPHRDDVEYVKGSINSANDINKSVDNIDIVFHIAAFSNIDKIPDNPIRAINTNIIGTANVLEAARKHDVERVLLASSYFVESGKGHLYTTTKIASERLCHDYLELYGLQYTILRYGTAYGSRSRGEDVVSIFVEKALKNKKLTIHGTGNQYRNFIYVKDLAQGNIAAMKKIAEKKTYILCGNKAITINEVAETIKRVLGEEIEITHTNARIDDSCGENVSNELAKKELGWEPKIEFEEGVKLYCEWYIREMQGGDT